MRNVYIVNGARTAFTTFGGSFKDVKATELGTATAIEALKRAEVEANEIEQVIYGNVIHSQTNAAYLSRHIALAAGIPIEVPALNVNRLCGSGMQAIVSGSQSIILGEANLALVGGAENMTMAPHANFASRFAGVRYGSFQFEDMLLNTLRDEYTGLGMGITAENLAEQYEISRMEQDEFSLLSQERATRAIEDGTFAEEIVPIEISTRQGKVAIATDEHVKKDMTLDKLSALKPSFTKDGTVTAGNASGINDGAASLVIASGEEVERRGAKPLAKIISWGIVGVDPSIMGIGPVPAIKQALGRANLTIEQIDRFEINEAFAAQYIAVERELRLDRSKVNVHGGAIALGHPVGASGARIVLALANELKREGLRYGVASLCIGGGQGIAVVIENEEA